MKTQDVLAPTTARPPRLAPIVGLVLCIAAALSPRGLAVAASPTAPATPRPALTVTAAPAVERSWPAVIEASGAIAPWQEATVAARVAGLPLIEIRADVGDRVRRGQLLARYDDSTVRADLARAEAGLAAAQASAQAAEANRDRALGLQATGAISAQDLLQSKTTAMTAVAQVAQARAALESARLTLAHTRVLAPDDGVVSSRSATLGAVAGSGTELFRLIRQNRLEWRAELGPTQLARVTPGMTASLKLPDGSTATGKVRSVAPALDGGSRLGIAYVELAPGSHARAAMFASGRLEAGARNVVTVPAESVVIRDGRSFVATLEGTRVRLRPVETGAGRDGLVEITRGLDAGASVVARGAGFLHEADVVRVVPATPPPRTVAERR
ncbi:MAG: efflux RND transporter periplasmic adaptor subunit [Steroidobacteraceae bacterium]